MIRSLLHFVDLVIDKVNTVIDKINCKYLDRHDGAWCRGRSADHLVDRGFGGDLWNTQGFFDQGNLGCSTAAAVAHQLHQVPLGTYSDSEVYGMYRDNVDGFAETDAGISMLKVIKEMRSPTFNLPLPEPVPIHPYWFDILKADDDERLRDSLSYTPQQIWAMEHVDSHPKHMVMVGLTVHCVMCDEQPDSKKWSDVYRGFVWERDG